jgi:hypothetical protein
MEMKYRQELEALPDCPPRSCQPCERHAYRFVYAEIGDSRNFLPAAKRNPAREFDSDEARCFSHALSFFSTQVLAIAFFRRLRMRHRNVAKTVGTCLAVGNLNAADGVASVVREDGHFSFFEAMGVELSDRFQIVEVLVP